MKIGTENSPRLYRIRETRDGLNAHQQETDSDQIKRFDEVILDASSRDIEDKLLTEKITKRLQTEVRSAGSEERINELKRAVADGTYLPDAKRIAVCMLNAGGELNE